MMAVGEVWGVVNGAAMGGKFYGTFREDLKFECQCATEQKFAHPIEMKSIDYRVSVIRTEKYMQSIP